MLFRKSPKSNLYVFLTALIAVGFLMGATFTKIDPVDAYGLHADGPERKALISISYTTYEWWLLSWNSSTPVCQVYIEHEGLPETEEVEYYCGTYLVNQWLNTPPCTFSSQITKISQCPGLYFHLAAVTPGERQIEVKLLPPEVFVDITGCEPVPPDNRCSVLPQLHFMGEEPLPNEEIINIQGYVGSEPFNCEGNECTVPVPATGELGIPIVFWAESSYGDASEIFTAQVRAVPYGDFPAPDVPTEDAPQWYVDIISSQYLGEISSSCSEIWSAFPPIGGPPLWLSSPDHPEALISTQPYYYLAGTMIREGLVDVGGCDYGGLELSGYATQCGLEAARPLINDWQNQFNSEIITVAKDTRIPSQLLKNIFSRESQFWPGFSASYQEAGLGHLSDMGADTILLWNPNFFSQFCPLVLDSTVCQRGFGNLDIAEQEMLRGALVQKVNAACPECPEGIDLRQANFSISIFARGLLANCEQVGQIMFNQTRLLAGEVSIYEDLWRFTLVNYNAGPGCLTDAIQRAIQNNYPINWESVKLFLEPGPCQASIDYVEDISYMPEAPTPTATPQLDIISATSTPSPTPTVQIIEPTQPEPTQITPTPTPTENGYPYPYPEPTYYPGYPYP